MPTRTRLLIMLFAAVLSAGPWASGQEAPSSGYRIRPQRASSQHLAVDADADAEPVPARVSVSLSDEVPTEDSAVGEVQDSEERTRRLEDASTEGPGEGGASSFRHSFTAPLRSSVSPSLGSSSAAPRNTSPLKLSPRSESGGRQLARPNAAAGLGSLGTVGGALAVVLGLFVVVVWVTRRVGPPGSASLPKEAVEVLGRSTLSGQHALQLVRVGSRLLLVALSSQGAATLTEITDPHEVERLTALCLGQRPGSASNTFAQTVAALERQASGRSFVDQRRPAASTTAGRPRTTRAA